MKKYNLLCSIILPVYNVDRFLGNCLESIIVQTYDNLEIIVVVDGSTDNSFSIAKKYTEKDSRINVVWQENAGSGPARNNGLLHAHGEFIFFVDPDDWIAKDYVEKMLDVCIQNNADLVLSTPIKSYFNKHLEKCKEKRSRLDDVIIDGVNEVRLLHAQLWEKGLLSAPHCKVYRNSIIRNNNLMFPSFRRSQDIAFNIDYYNFTKKIIQTSYTGYYYRILFEEACKKYKRDYIVIVKAIAEKLHKLYSDWGVNMEKEKLYRNLYGGVYGLVEACIAKNEEFLSILEDEAIRTIVLDAAPPTKNLKIVKELIRKRKYLILKWYVKIVYQFKLICRSH